nr:low temperature requirement protein A [Mesorhizobium sp.]
MSRILTFQLAPRDQHEPNRSSTSLELMFDLATAVAVAAAAHGLAQEVGSGHVAAGATRFLCSFFMAWLAWANYTWFASAYDNKSAAFRALSMAIMFGSLTLAGGIHAADGDQPIWLALVGFIIMRLGMIVLWLGAANGDRETRPTALRYAAGIALMQLYWTTVIVVLPPQASLYLPLFVLGAFGELTIPALAEHKTATNWHRGHIIDRYNLFNIIVLGECFAVIAAIIADSKTPNLRHFWLAGLCSVIAFSMWGLYFDRKEQLLRRDLGSVLVWAYGHYAVFAAGAATAAGFAVVLATVAERAEVRAQSASLAIGIPIAFYLSALWLVRDRAIHSGAMQWLLMAAAALILATAAFAPHALEVTAAVLVAAAIARRHLHPHKADRS